MKYSQKNFWKNFPQFWENSVYVSPIIITWVYLSYMKIIITESQYNKIFESFSFDKLPYQDWELGIIKAWGDLLYLAYHIVPQKISEDRLVSKKDFRNEFVNYLYNSEEDEDIVDWMSEAPPTYDRGKKALYDKNRMSEVLFGIARQTKITEPLIVYRYEENEGEGWNSFTLNPSSSYEGDVKSYRLPEGTPVIFTGDLADKDEVIVHLTSEQKNKFIIN